MSAQEQISKLQGLLARIQTNASRPRASAPLPPPVAFAAPPSMPVAPPPAFVAPPPAPFAAKAPSFSEQSVDDLLGVSAEAEPMPVDIDVPLDTVPPAAPVAADAPPIDDAFGLDSEVSEVRVTTATREPSEVTVAAIAAEAEPLGTEELSEDDLVEVTEGTPPPATTDVDIDFEDEDEPPASSQRSKVASSMDEALAAAAEQLDGEREVPLKTPPPESGPQEAPLPTGIAAPAAPDVDSLLGHELDIPTREVVGARGPTPEQLGQTIDLDEARGPMLELAVQPASEAPTAAHVEELEMALPGRDVVGGYDESLQPPPEARDELEAHRRRLEDDIAPPPESLATLPSYQPGPPVAEIVPAYNAPVYDAPMQTAPMYDAPMQTAPMYDAPMAAPAYDAPMQTAPAYDAPMQTTPTGPEVVARPMPMGNPESFTSVRETFRPSSFVELLDASLGLSGP